MLNASVIAEVSAKNNGAKLAVRSILSLVFEPVAEAPHGLQLELGCAGWVSITCPCTVRTDNALKVRFSATLGEEPEVEVGLV